ncbi:hypothetical protein [Shimia sp. NS0008-38b]|uniref:hypothetical protein n=1 Tax=Shimia sp. NS0008-38b TaxID=3127653 RepID=UPI00333EAE0F
MDQIDALSAQPRVALLFQSSALAVVEKPQHLLHAQLVLCLGDVRRPLLAREGIRVHDAATERDAMH